MQEITPIPQDNAEPRVSLGALVGAVRKHWLLAASLAVVTLAATAAYTFAQTKIYEASATILFDPNVPRPLGEQVQTVGADASSYWNNKEYYKTQEWMIQSNRVASEVVRSLGLNRDPLFLKNLAAKSAHPIEPVSVDEASRILLRRVTVEQIKDSRLTTVKYRDADPARAQKVLTALVDTYVQQNLDGIFEAATTAADWLRTQVATLRSELEKSERALHDYKKSKNILSVSMDDQSNMLREEMRQLNAALTEVRAKREQVAARLGELNKIPADDPGNLPATELIESPVLQGLRASYVDSKQRLEAAKGEGRGDNHPVVASVQAQVNAVREALLNEVRNIKGAAETELAALDSETERLRSLYLQAEGRALDVNLLEIEFNRLRRAKENNERLFSLVIEKSKETDLTRMLRVNNIRVVDRPVLPRAPVSPKITLNLVGGVVFGLVLGLVAAIGREQLDRTLKLPDDIERELGLPFLGLLPAMEVETRQAKGRQLRRSRGSSAPPPPELGVHRNPASGLAEAARSIRTNILFMSPDRPYKTLLVTSAGPSEGKTTVACSLAITMAQAGQRVVLVDCDLRRPRIHRVFGRSNQTGLTDALLDPSQEESIAWESSVPNLWVISTGPLPPNPAELLQTESFANLLRGLQKRFDRVIVDSPPVVPVTDAAVLSTIIEGTVVVVRAGRTTKDVAKRATRALRGVSGHIVGTVLNGVELGNGRYYGMYQYYAYGREDAESSAA